MIRSIHILLPVVLMALGANLMAQQKDKGKAAAANTSKILMPDVYLGHSDNRTGPIKREQFISLMKQGLTSHDAKGNNYRVVGFDFGYAEQKMYEDSAGNAMPMMDMATEYCAGDTLSADIAYGSHMLQSAYLTDSADIPKGLYERVKPGDSLYFDHIRIVKINTAGGSIQDTTAIAGRGMKFYIVK